MDVHLEVLSEAESEDSQVSATGAEDQIDQMVRWVLLRRGTLKQSETSFNWEVFGCLWSILRDMQPPKKKKSRNTYLERFWDP